MREEAAEVIVIGSGFGGTATASHLLESGHDVLMLERGAWPSRDTRDTFESTGGLAPHLSGDVRYDTPGNSRRRVMGPYFCVGGPSVFFAAVSTRLRAADFYAAPEITCDSGAEWPLTYQDLEPFYSEAEHLLGVA